MIAKKDWVADGNTSRFLPDIIVRTEDFARVYAYVYDINGVDGQLQTPSLPFKYPTNLYIRTNNVPTSADIITIDNWDLVNNNISFYSKPLSGTTVWIEVATTTEEFGETLTQPAVKRAEDAAIASELSATNAAVSASTATAQATIATTQANTATAQATIATTKASEASLSATNAGISATASATSATASATSATASATSASESATSATASANSATASATSASNASTSETNAANSANSAATSATGAAISETNALSYATSINPSVLLHTVGTGGGNPEGYSKTESDTLLSNKVDKITSTDNAIVRFSGTTGQVQNSGVTIDDSGNITGGSFNGYGGAGFKNYIINGGFDVWQRGTSFSDMPSGTYFADRWYSYTPQGSTNLQRLATGTYADNGLVWNKTPNKPEYIIQLIENLRRFLGKTVTASFWIHNTGTQPITIETGLSYVYDGSANIYESNNVTFEFAPNEAKRVSFTRTLSYSDVYSGKTIGANSALQFFIVQRENSNPDGATIIHNVQLEEGSVATPFEQRPYGLELSLCQRYYETSGSANEFYELPVSSGTQIQRQSVSYKVSKRTVPTVTRTRISYSTSSSSVAYSWEDGFQMDFVGGQYAFESYTWTADAEL